jgi:methionyl-tRNA formyltransferase
MRIALMGSVSSSATALEGFLEAGAELCGVLGVAPEFATKISAYVDLAPIAARAGWPYQPFRKVAEPKVAQFLQRVEPDLLLVIGLSQLVPDNVIALAKHGGVGYHPTLLPEGRGRAPIAWTILRNRPAAVNLFRLVDAPDAGDLLVQVPVPLQPRETSLSLAGRTNEVLRAAVHDLWPSLQRGEFRWTPQDHSRATHYPQRTPNDGVIDWNVPSARLERFVRGVGRPYPGAFSTLDDQRVTIWSADIGSRGGAPGAIIAADPLEIATADGSLVVTEHESSVPLAAGMRLPSVDSGTWDDPAVPSPTMLAKKVMS